MKLYDVEFKIKNSQKNDYNGFEVVKTAGWFEPSWDINLLFHDIIEHFFEQSKYFYTSEFSQAGECVAMGIRTYLNDYSSLVTDFAGYNKYRGVEWNSWTTCISQIRESINGESEYSNNFNYTHLKSWDKKNIFKGVAKYYDEYYKVEEFYEKIELAFSYGYYLGEKLFNNKIDIIYRFFRNLREFLSEIEILNLTHYDTSIYLLENTKFIVNVTSNNIVGYLDGVLVSSNVDSYKSIKSFNKKYNLIW